VTAGTGVVALGGGAVMDAGTRDLLTAVPTVWLRVGLAGALARVGMNQARPLLLGNVRGRLLALLEERAPLYEQVSRARVDTDGLEPAAVADAVVALVAAGGTP
ncbi:MAG TPA: shikimate kinase, partial [Candidatus Nanopelagicales bacterium]|nr:shikimate kinase [Candidatus Nanopelagicales bacterium]